MVADRRRRRVPARTPLPDMSNTYFVTGALGCIGAWVVERVGDKTRVSLAASIEATRVVPGLIVDMVATKALGRATAWLKD